MFLMNLQAEVSRFLCRIFHCFAYFLKMYLEYHRILSLISFALVIVLHLEPFENHFFELDFSISTKHVSTVKPSQEGEFFCTVMKYFFEILLPFHISKHFWNNQTLFLKNMGQNSTTIVDFHRKKNIAASDFCHDRKTAITDWLSI